jgi:D-alanyl-D-alanine carboxypeptidase
MTGQPVAPARVETVKVASLATASDAQSDAIAPAQPIYIPRRNLAANVAVNEASGWSVQVGAFQSRVATDQALYKAMNKLPAPLNSRATAMIVPLRTADASWVFRARLSGFTQTEAQQACAYLQDCLTISPQAN